MATGRPPIDPFNPIIQALIEDFDRMVGLEGEAEDHQANEAGRAYNDQFKRPYICALMADVIGGRWQMGSSQDEISERLGILSDRSWVSRALHQGWMSLDIFMRLRCWPLRPKDWEPNVDLLAGDMGRSAFIGAARCYASLVTTRPTLVPQRLNDLSYELVCEIFARIATWLPAQLTGQVEMAAAMVNDVCQDNRRNVCPAWYTASQKRQVEAEIKRLTSNADAAFEHLGQLQRDWLDVFAKTDSVLEQEAKDKP